MGLCVDNSYFRDCPIIQNLVVFRYALRAVDLKDMVVIDLWNAGEQRPVETLNRRGVIPGQPVAGPGTLRTLQRALKAGIIVFGRGLWHTGQRDPGCCPKRTGKPAVIWQDHWCDQPYRPAYPAHTCEDRCEKDRGRDFNYTCEGVGEQNP